MAEPRTPWPHAPTHQLAQAGTFIVTAGTYLKAHHFRGAARLRVLHRGLLTVAREFNWNLEAWAVFSNHYHFVGHSSADQPDATNMSAMLNLLRFCCCREGANASLQTRFAWLIDCPPQRAIGIAYGHSLCNGLRNQ